MVRTPEQRYATTSTKAFLSPTRVSDKFRSFSRSFFFTIGHLGSRFKERRFVRCLYGHAVFEEDRTRFERFVRRILNRGDVINTSQLLDLISGHTPVDGCYFHLSFDDGFRNVFQNAIPALSERGVTATIFVAPRYIGGGRDAAEAFRSVADSLAAPIELADWDDLKRAAAAGFEIGSHSLTHARLSAISGDPRLLTTELIDL